jgi:signal transduction histidine kinase/HAMP domain-containing protein
MKIRTQFRITLAFFSIMLIVIASSMMLTSVQVQRVRNQEDLANNVSQAANDLSYLSSDYVIYQESQQLGRWQSKFDSFSNDIENLNVDNIAQKALVQDMQASKQRLKEVFDSVVSSLSISNQSESEFMATFQVSWSRMAIQSQELMADSSLLAQQLHEEVNQLNQTNLFLILAMTGAFGTFVAAIYFQTFRRTLKSIAELHSGTTVIGSGDLDFKVKESKEDEIGELSKAFNDMAINLKMVMASKADLEREIAERKKAEVALIESELVARRRAEELEILQQRLEEKAAEVEEYAARMEVLAEERAVKLRDAERLAAIGATAGMVGHDIRNPLQAITSDVYLASSDLRLLPESEQRNAALESLDEIEKNVDYINKIVQDLQDYARPLTPLTKTVSLEELSKEVLYKNGVPSRIKVTLEVDEKVRKIISDAALLKRVLANLVTNAVQAMPGEGKLSVRAIQEQNDVVITVQDTGVGIPDEVKEKLFTPLFTTKSKGQGFGLAVVKRVTEALGGNVTFESKTDQGTKFTVRLPNKI